MDLSDLRAPKPRVVYTIRATVKGSGTFRWNHTASARMPFIPLDRPNLTFALRHEARRDCQIIPSGNLWRESEDVRDIPHDLLPPYTPVVFTEASITSSEPLRPGDSMPLRLVVTVPVKVAKELDLHIRNVSLALRGTTLSPGRRETILSHIKISDTRMNLRVTPDPSDSTFEVDPRWWKDCVIPHVTPKLSSKVVGQNYWLQVLSEFKSEVTSLSTVGTAFSTSSSSCHQAS